MKKTDQTDTTFVIGNCFQACVASIFELDLDKVPAFMDEGVPCFWDKVNEWCSDNYLIYTDILIEDDEVDKFKNCYMIATGKSPRNPDKYHCVVWHNGEIVHDPHPTDKRGILGKPEVFGVFILEDPAANLLLDGDC